MNWTIRAARLIARGVGLLWYPWVALYRWGTSGNAGASVGLLRTRLAPLWRVLVRNSVVLVGFGVFAGLQVAVAYLIIQWWWWFIVGFMIISAVLALVAYKPTHAFLVWLVISPLATIFLKLDWGKGLPAITFDRVAIYAMALLLLFKMMKNRVPPRRPLAGELLMLAFAVFVCLGLSWQEHRSIVDNINVFVGMVVLVLVLYYIAKAVIVKPEQVVWLMVCLVVVGVYSALSGFYEHYTGNQWFSALIGVDVKLVWEDVGKGRAGGPFFNTTVYGSFLSLTTFVAFHLAAYSKKVLAKVLYGVSIVIMVIGAYFSYTRGAYIPMLLFVLLMPLLAAGSRRHYATLLVAAVILSIVTVPVMLSNDEFYQRMTNRDTAIGRIAITASLWNAFKHNFWFGVGTNNVDPAIEQYITNAGNISGMWVRAGDYKWPHQRLKPITTSHNSFLTVFVEYGVIGGVLYCGSLISFFALLVAVRKRLPAYGVLGKDFVTLVAVFILGHMVSISTYDIRYFAYANYVFWILIAMVVRLGELGVAQVEATDVVCDPEPAPKELTYGRAS